MKPIKTASTLERIIRNGIMTVMVVVFAALSFYDGYVGYPKKNLAQAKVELPADQQNLARINPRVISDNLVDIKLGGKLSDVEELLGPPAWSGSIGSNTGGPTGGPTKSVWFGPGGTLLILSDVRGNLVSQPEWKKGKHSEVDLFIQKVMGLVLAPFGLVLLIRWLLMMVRGAELSDAGLKLSGAPLIPFDAMTGLDASEYKDKGRVHLVCDLGKGESTYILDDYKLRAFPAIVAEICARKGFEDPTKKDDASPDEAASDAGPPARAGASGAADESDCK
jgi:hypothetical protein